jgi:hypothetical protein
MSVTKGKPRGIKIPSQKDGRIKFYVHAVVTGGGGENFWKKSAAMESKWLSDCSCLLTRGAFPFAAGSAKKEAAF